MLKPKADIFIFLHMQHQNAKLSMLIHSVHMLSTTCSKRLGIIIKYWANINMMRNLTLNSRIRKASFFIKIDLKLRKASPSWHLISSLDFRSYSALIASPSPQGFIARLKQESQFMKFQTGFYAIWFNH